MNIFAKVTPDALSRWPALFFILASPWVVLRGSRSLRRGFAWAAATSFTFNAYWIVIFGSERSELDLFGQGSAAVGREAARAEARAVIGPDPEPGAALEIREVT